MVSDTRSLTLESILWLRHVHETYNQMAKLNATWITWKMNLFRLWVAHKMTGTSMRKTFQSGTILQFTKQQALHSSWLFYGQERRLPLETWFGHVDDLGNEVSDYDLFVQKIQYEMAKMNDIIS